MLASYKARTWNLVILEALYVGVRGSLATVGELKSRERPWCGVRAAPALQNAEV